MTGAQVKLGVLKPIDLRAILNWRDLRRPGMEKPRGISGHNGPKPGTFTAR
jgi:hypothetical protein